jgi:hypothetical protein
MEVPPLEGYEGPEIDDIADDMHEEREKERGVLL